MINVRGAEEYQSVRTPRHQTVVGSPGFVELIRRDVLIPSGSVGLPNARVYGYSSETMGDRTSFHQRDD